ncbi:MAG: ATP-binding protein [Armatimonadetes bacterium]|nr:ATP-binding protein [Armatimonadota bacterium]
MTGLHPVKEQGRPEAVYADAVALLRVCAQAPGVALVRLEDAVTVRTLGEAPEGFHRAAVSPADLARLLEEGRIAVEAGEVRGSVRVALPLRHGGFRGAVLLYCPAEFTGRPGFMEFAELARAEMGEVVRLACLAEDVDLWRTRSAAILETIPQGVIFLENSGRHAWVNAPGAAMLGVRPDANDPPVIAEAMRRFRRAAANAPEIEEEAASLFASPGRSIRDWEWRFGDPAERVYSVSCAPLESRSVRGRIWVFTDVSRLHQAGRELREMNAELTLKRAEAEAQSSFKSEFLANMSHEIRTPLNGVLGLAQLLSRDDLSPGQRRTVTHIREAGQSLLTILNDILDLSKIEAGRLRVERRPFDLSLLLEHMQSLMGSAARAKGLEMVIDAGRLACEPGARHVGDSLRLQQVLTNLLGNAVKFTDRGEVRLSVTGAESGPDTVRLRFEVRDTGIGIAPETAARLFAPFVQAESGVTRRYGGTGLGLAISKQLVDLMGGAMGMESAPGVGSAFWFELPLGRHAEESSPPDLAWRERPAPGPRLRGLRFLVVDDSAMNREVARQALAVEGASCDLAFDGRQAIDALRERRTAYDAVLMDVRMPDVDGLAATRCIRRELGLAALPVLALTAGVLPEEREQALAAGVNEVLAKPLDLDLLAPALLQWVRKPSPAPPAAEDRAREPVPTLAGIDHAMAVRAVGGDGALYVGLLGIFRDEHARTVERIGADLAAGAAGEALRRLHTLRGGAGALGAHRVMETAEALEQAVKAGRTGLGRDLAALARRVDLLINAAKPLLPLPAAAPLALRQAMEAELAAALGAETADQLAAAVRRLRFDEAARLLAQAHTEPQGDG